jgi:DNA-binding transcriptional MerR regulator
MFHHPFYLHGGRLYQIPESESEHTLFNVASAEGASVPPKNPRGGHNYYNARDMERLQRRMKAILKDKVTTASDQIARSESVSPQPNTDNQPQRAMEWMQDYLTREEREAKQWESNTLRQKQPSGLIRRTSA